MRESVAIELLVYTGLSRSEVNNELEKPSDRGELDTPKQNYRHILYVCIITFQYRGFGFYSDRIEDNPSPMLVIKLVLYELNDRYKEAVADELERLIRNSSTHLTE